MTEKIVLDFALLSRGLYIMSEQDGEKLLRAVSAYARTGECDSNADEDSVCGGVCPTCKPERE